MQYELEVIAVAEATSCVERKADGRARSLRRAWDEKGMKSSADATDTTCRVAHLVVVVQVANPARLDGGERRERHSGAESLGGHRAIGSERRNERASRQPAHETIDTVRGGTAVEIMKRRDG